MHCNQCQETTKNISCTIKGTCGKTPEMSNMQDLLLFITRGIASYNYNLRKFELASETASYFIIDALFSTITNANFDIVAIENKIKKGLELKEKLAKKAFLIDVEIPEKFSWNGEKDQWKTKAEEISIPSNENEDITSLKELVLYGIKGMAAYLEHAKNLNEVEEDIFEFVESALLEISREDIDLNQLIDLTLKTGEFGVKAVTLLDKANVEHYGNPEITTVSLETRNNPGILISGHDLKDLEQLLIQTENSGVDVYTHCEMLPAHYYPIFKKYEHLVGNYGGAWWNQKKEFETFNGPILFTSNCIVPPSKHASYTNHIFTTGSAGLEGAKHISEDENGNKDFSEIISLAKTCPPPTQIEEGSIIGGFAHHQTLQFAETIIEAVKNGNIKQFYVLAGCDGRMKSREYYTDFAKALPQDTIILTAGCAKYRYNKLSLGDINGIPRLLDAGQCNDSYSLVVVALKLKEVLGLDDINELPIIYNIAWYEQKAVIVLLSLLYLGVKNIHLGPTLPAFLSPNIANILIDQFKLGAINTVEQDLEKFLAM